VLTADPDSRVGSYSVVDLVTRSVTKDIPRGGVHSDALARSFGGRVYVVNRLRAANIQIIDPQQGYTTPANAQVSVGNGTNPQDIAFLNANKAYVSRLQNTSRLLILNPTTLAILGELELGSLIKPNDPDGSPEPAYMLVNNGLLYVVLRHLGNFVPVARGEIVVIDPVTDSIVKVIQLPFTNPFSQLHFSPTLKRILVSCVGNFGVSDSGIVAIDPVTNTVDPSISITEAAMRGDITDFEIVSSTKAFAIVTDANFAHSLVTFNPSTGQRLTTVLGPLNVSIPQTAINSRNELYVAVNDSTTTTPGVRVFDTVTDRDLIPGPLNVGQLPPSWVLFLE
jgi:DNA-binding beta-propeller fold protein YncE